MTIDNLIIDLGEKEFLFGLTYVALSRIKNVSTLRL